MASWSVISEVITPTADHNLTTMATLRLMLDLTRDDDEKLTLLLAQATALVEGYCGRVFVKEVMRDTFSVTGGPEVLLLSRKPVTAVSSIEEDGSVLAVTDDYTLDKATGELRRVGSWWAGPTVVVDYTAGYILPGSPTPTLPADIEGAVIDIVRSAWHGKSRDAMVKSEEVPGVYRVSYGSDAVVGQFPYGVAERLDRYKPGLA